ALCFFSHPAQTHSSTLSLHDSLPILQLLTGSRIESPGVNRQERRRPQVAVTVLPVAGQSRKVGDQCSARPRQPIEQRGFADVDRSEEHTSELQSRENLVCRLLLEKKK